MMMSLGMFVFSIDTLAFDELQHRESWRYAKNQRVGGRDAAQFVGPGEDSVSLSGSTVHEIGDGAAALADLRQMAGEGTAWPLVAGTGEVLGSFIIVGIDQRGRHHFADGRPRAIEFGIELDRVDDESRTEGLSW